jgi:hypothetical protein
MIPFLATSTIKQFSTEWFTSPAKAILPTHERAFNKKETSVEAYNLEITELITSRYHHIKQVLNVVLAKSLVQRTDRYLELHKLHSNMMAYIQLCSISNKKVSKKMAQRVLKAFDEIEQKLLSASSEENRPLKPFSFSLDRLLENWDFQVSTFIQTNWRKLNASL